MKILKNRMPKQWVIPIVVMAFLLSCGTAFALFSSTISFGGLNMTVGNSALQVQLPDGSWVSQDWTSGYTLAGLYPGLSSSADFAVKNASTAPISLKVSAQLLSVEGDWEDLKDVVTVRIHAAGNTRSSTGYKTLAEWNAEGGISLPGSAIAQNETRQYTLDVEIDKDYGNELANKQLHDIHVLITGVQDD